ncbi:MAG: (E)-4-hydroxy-3-methylbut-2-enyl-diphosphate synthase [Leptospirales bacterium]|nr:(E)-4-hydroxy-3-methylbut-2-enyl-diphosphate synthase [Leptospirales bacterium]
MPTVRSDSPGALYCSSPLDYQRFATRVVMVGDVPVGGAHPIVLQSMCIQDTMQTEEVIAEAIELYRAGSQIVRITAPGPRDAENLGRIKAGLRKRGFHFPIVADIHFAPKAAMIAAEHVEKVRINPGNFADRKRFAVLEYSDSEYAEELLRVEEVFLPLVQRCKELGRAMRIGANHGSLSDRVMNRYGDTPLGMVESALEFIRIARSIDYHEIIVSMKASNPQVMVQAYRLLTARFREMGWDYPLHLGVTEAGSGQDGRIKSAIGIRSLLDDGIGDTIRVSLTEDAIHEIPAARRIAAPYQSAAPATGPTPAADRRLGDRFRNSITPYEYRRFLSETAHGRGLHLGAKHQHRILLALDDSEAARPELLHDLRQRGADAFVVSPATSGIALQADAGPVLVNCETQLELCEALPLDASGALLHVQAGEGDPARLLHALAALHARDQMAILRLRVGDLSESALDHVRTLLRGCSSLPAEMMALQLETSPSAHPSTVRAVRALAALLLEFEETWNRPLSPLVLAANCASFEEGAFEASAAFGPPLLDGLGDALLLHCPGSAQDRLKLQLDILQAVRLRLSKTEFISCPSCGRTLFDLQTTTARIQARLGHLKGVKIAVMGCIVNGPGEMADADFGYVGAGPGKIHLYLGKEIVKANVDASIADEELERLIREHGRWAPPQAPGQP